MSSIEKNIAGIRERMKKAAEKAGRDPSGIRLIAVTKTATLDQIKEAVQCGIRDFGENRLQAAEPKMLSLLEHKDIRWHMIGHLQTNKVKKAVELFWLIHGVDSLRLAKEIDKEAAKKGPVFPVLLEVNIGEEDSKFGVRPQDVKELLSQCSTLQSIKAQGLMAMAPFSRDP